MSDLVQVAHAIAFAAYAANAERYEAAASLSNVPRNALICYRLACAERYIAYKHAGELFGFGGDRDD